MSINRKPFEEDVVTDDDLGFIASLQGDAWQAEKVAQRAVAKLETRLKLGARVIARQYYFDQELGMVRSRKRTSRKELNQ